MQGKRQYKDEPSCGFNKNISISFGDMVFCIAYDECNVVKLNDRCISISEEDRQKIDKIFEKYGGHFPAI
ncbi:hypothetical protein P261_02913 [Lachnospiraceae bacterium TWA4]|nr:hypothetical protein P261_02913 [Lachnospiraceae bacterium TWA4]